LKLIARLPSEKFERMADKFKSALRVVRARLAKQRNGNNGRSVPKTEFQQILEECLAKLSSGTATVEECLARYPQHAGELRPLLRTVYFLNFKRDEQPALAYNVPTRAGLARFLPSVLMQPLGNPNLVWRTSVVFAMLAVAVLVTGTASAQFALPGDAFYGWKRASEDVWRTLSSDRVATELAISNRRISEVLAVANDPELSHSAMEGYLESLDRLKSVEDEGTITRIASVLVLQHGVLRQAGIVAIELDNHLVRELKVLPPSAVATRIPATDVPPPTSPPSQSNPTDPEPAGPKPTKPDTDPTEPPATQPPATEPPTTQPPVTQPTPIVTEPPVTQPTPIITEPPVTEPTPIVTEPPPTEVPTEPPPTSVPTEPPPTSVPTEPPPTSIPTEPPPVPTETEATPVPPNPNVITPEGTTVPEGAPTATDAPVSATDTDTPGP